MNHYEVYKQVMSDTYNKNYTYNLQRLLRDYNNEDVNLAIESLSFALSFFQQKKEELKVLEGKDSMASKMVQQNMLLEDQGE
jgi:hypothetical protein